MKKSLNFLILCIHDETEAHRYKQHTEYIAIYYQFIKQNLFIFGYLDESVLFFSFLLSISNYTR